MMHVELLTSKASLKEMVSNAVTAGRICRGATAFKHEKDDEGYLRRIIAMGHESVLEHINLTYRITGISRALLQELARHRHISLSVESTRSTLGKELFSADDDQRRQDAGHRLLDCLTTASGTLPEAITFDSKEDKEDFEGYMSLLFRQQSEYLRVLCMAYNLLKSSTISSKALNDFFKYFIPEAVSTRLVMTCNLRELRHIVNLRTAPGALFEFRVLAYNLYDILGMYRYLVEDCVDPKCQDVVRDFEEVLIKERVGDDRAPACSSLD